MAVSTTLDGHSYAYHLDPQSRRRGVAFAGRTEALFARLDAGMPVTLAVLGASVAEQAGCFDQPGKECQRFDGKEVANPGWGEPKERPFKGWAIRVFEWLNTTWPHVGNVLHNGAQSATPLHAASKCLSSFIPPHPDLVLLEPMSMGGLLRADGVESILRKLLSPANGLARPAVAFLNIPLWSRDDVPSAYGPASDGACKYNGEAYERNVHMWGAGQREQHTQPEIERQVRRLTRRNADTHYV